MSSIVLDTNILLRRANSADPRHGIVQLALEHLTARRVEVCITLQCIMEFWVVATRPTDVNGLGMAVADVRREVDRFLDTFTILPDPEDLLQRWLDLCTTHAVCGRPAHDARLVAVMMAHGIDELLALNPGDFARYPEIACLAPEDV